MPTEDYALTAEEIAAASAAGSTLADLILAEEEGAIAADAVITPAPAVVGYTADAVTFSEAEAARLIRQYELAEKAILERLDYAIRRGNQTHYLESMLKQVQTVRKELLAGGRTWSTKAMRDCYVKGALSVDKSLHLKYGFNMLDQKAMKLLADNSFSRLEEIDQVIGRRVDDVFRQIQLDTVRAEMAGAYDVRTGARLMRKRFIEEGIPAFVDKAGREWSIKAYCDMAAHSVCMEAMRTGAINRLIEFGLDLALIMGGYSERSCGVCKTWAGKVVSLTGRTPGYPTLAEAQAAGVFHPRCTHCISAAISAR